MLKCLIFIIIIIYYYYPCVEASWPDALRQPGSIDHSSEDVRGAKESQVDKHVVCSNQRRQVNGRYDAA